MGLTTFYRNGIFNIHSRIFIFKIINKYLFAHRINWEEKMASENSIEFCGASTNSSPFIEASSTEKSRSIMQSRVTFLTIYTVIMVLGTICYLIRSFSFFNMCLQISINLHDMLFRGITRSKMIFFNNNPSGRVLNRFARDINNVDSELPFVLIDIMDVSTFQLTFFNRLFQ